MKKFAVAPPIILCFAILIIVVGATAGPSSRRSKLTFSGSVRVPGASLSAGTYYFSTPSRDARTLVRVENENLQLVTQFMGLSDYRRESGHTVIIFGDHECGPKAIKSWFYAGGSSGIRFVYSEEEAALIAASCNEPVPETHERTLDTSNLQSSPVYLMTPQKQEEAYKSEALSASDQVDQNGFDADPR
jgi:hypothetical protein